MKDLQAIFQALRDAVPRDLDTEESSIRFFMRHRFDRGPPRCGAPLCGGALTRTGIHLACASCRRRVTIFVGTPLARLRRPSVKGILLGVRGMRFDKRGIAARPLAKLLGISPTTLWRHWMKVRRLLPPLTRPTSYVSRVQVCGRKSGAVPEWIDVVIPEYRIVAESVRVWLAGTHRGVTAKYLHCYLREWSARTRAYDLETKDVSWSTRRMLTSSAAACT